jgi:hypothetical protein
MTPQQEAIASAATAFLALLDATVPSDVAHYAVEGVRSDLNGLRRIITTVHTHDTKEVKA